MMLDPSRYRCPRCWRHPLDWGHSPIVCHRHGQFVVVMELLAPAAPVKPWRRGIYCQVPRPRFRYRAGYYEANDDD